MTDAESVSITQQEQNFFNDIHDLMLHEAACIGDDSKLSVNIVYTKGGKFDIDYKDGEFGDKTALHCAAENGNW